MDIQKIAAKAEKSGFYKWIMNQILWRVVPFNRPHGFWVNRLTSETCEIKIPYKRNNRNHLKGLHACGLATAGEYSSGLLLLFHLDPKEYRLIMKTLKADYFYQGKMAASARFNVSKEEINQKVLLPLKTHDSVDFTCKIPVYDSDENHLCTITTFWQIKPWSKTKTKR